MRAVILNIIVLNLGLTLATPFSITTLTESCDIKDGECDGSSLDFSVDSQDINGCINFCKESETNNQLGIAFASFNLGVCGCFSSCDEPNTNCEECKYSDISSCEVSECSKIGLCKGSLLDVVEAGSKRSCLSKCQDMEECKWFSFSQERKICLLFGDCPANTFFEDESFVSGQTECAIPPSSM